jgi:hypothetical protein
MRWPFSSQAMIDPGRQSVSKATAQYRRVNVGSVSTCHSRSGMVLMNVGADSDPIGADSNASFRSASASTRHRSYWSTQRSAIAWIGTGFS